MSKNVNEFSTMKLMCDNSPPIPIDIFSHRSQIIKVCFKYNHLLHSNTRYDNPILWIVWIPEEIKTVLKTFEVAT